MNSHATVVARQEFTKNDISKVTTIPQTRKNFIMQNKQQRNSRELCESSITLKYKKLLTWLDTQPAKSLIPRAGKRLLCRKLLILSSNVPYCTVLVGLQYVYTVRISNIFQSLYILVLAWYGGLFLRDCVKESGVSCLIMNGLLSVIFPSLKRFLCWARAFAFSLYRSLNLLGTNLRQSNLLLSLTKYMFWAFLGTALVTFLTHTHAHVFCQNANTTTDVFIPGSAMFSF